MPAPPPAVVADPDVVRVVTFALPALALPLAVVVDADGVWVEPWWPLEPALVLLAPLVVAADPTVVFDTRRELLEIAPPVLCTTPAPGRADPNDDPGAGLVRLADAPPVLVTAPPLMGV
ncbi:hypothetical protein ACQ86B_28810 (plasmid) [Mycolicibacterium aichiense]|uniref:hypothetical protein n=1 Tax=Mycolicibacterium aichiense TaxID=1799 RepID=UPI003D66E522